MEFRDLKVMAGIGRSVVLSRICLMLIGLRGLLLIRWILRL